VQALLDWTERDIWLYIQREGIPIPKMYFARNGRDGKRYRFRSLGCWPISGPVESDADTIDGIINEDKLGLDMICVQAKRWKDCVGRPVVQAFAGSMESHRAKKGVLISTSTFSRDARDFVDRIERKIVLIDGQQLAQLMIDYNVGVATARTYTIKKIDSDYFMDAE
jgi:predicted helicase